VSKFFAGLSSWQVGLAQNYFKISKGQLSRDLRQTESRYLLLSMNPFREKFVILGETKVAGAYDFYQQG
jgi:hypothetical protein